MGSYILRRLLLMIPTLFGIMVLSFLLTHFLPGGPVERAIAQLTGADAGATARFSGSRGETAMRNPGVFNASDSAVSLKYRGSQGLDPEFIKSLEKQFGFDKPPLERFWLMIKNYVTFNFDYLT